MRQYAWYSPEIDTIVLQTIVDECYITFEWGWHDMHCAIKYLDIDPQAGGLDLLDYFLWFPIGEI